MKLGHCRDRAFAAIKSGGNLCAAVYVYTVDKAARDVSVPQNEQRVNRANRNTTFPAAHVRDEILMCPNAIVAVRSDQMVLCVFFIRKALQLAGIFNDDVCSDSSDVLHQDASSSHLKKTKHSREKSGVFRVGDNKFLTKRGES